MMVGWLWYLSFSWLLSGAIVHHYSYYWRCNSAEIINFMLDYRVCVCVCERERERESKVVNRWLKG